MLNISENSRNIIITEFRYVASRMREAQNPADKTYLFSATWGMLMRVFNIEFDPELVFAYQVLNLAGTQISGRIASPQQGEMYHTPLQFLEQLENDIDEMANRWEQGKEISDLLEHIAMLGYAATGNGFYLVSKGLISLS